MVRRHWKWKDHIERELIIENGSYLDRQGEKTKI